MKKLLLIIFACAMLCQSRNTYAQAPTITSFSPTSGAVGTLVTIRGTNLSTPTNFTIGGVAAIVVSNTPTSLVGMVMPNATTGNISLSTAAGTTNSTTNFTVTPTQFPSAQMGEKLVGTGNVGVARQGQSVAVSADGNTAIVGGDIDANNVGAAWVFIRNNNGVWTQQARLVGTNFTGTRNQQGFLSIIGVNISADGNTAIVGNFTDNNSVGAVWIFVRNNGVWTQQGNKLVGTGNIGGSFQGWSVAMSADGNTAIVGGYGDFTNAGSGSSWIFVRNNGVWTQQGNKLVGTGNIGVSLQGGAVAMSADGNTVVVGGTNDNNNTGAAWVFVRNNGVWTQQGNKLVGTGGVGASRQGASVSISADGNTIATGGRDDNSKVGATWVFVRSNGIWTQQGQKLVGTGGIGNPEQGIAVALNANGNILSIGGALDNGQIGGTWIFVRNNEVWTQQGNKLVGTGNIRPPLQGSSVAMSADGSTAVVGGRLDNSDQGATWIFTVRPPTPAAITAKSPSSSGFTASWGKVEDVFSYKIDVAIDPNFTNILSGYENLDVKNTSLVINGLAGGINYYYRVRSSNGASSFNSNVVPVAVPKGPELIVTAPNGGEFLQYRTFFTISFNSNLSGDSKIELIGGDKPLTIAQVPQGIGSFRWYVPSSLPARSGYKIVVSSLGSTKLQDQSEVFNIGIEPPEIKLTPNFPTTIAYKSSAPLSLSVEAGSSLRTLDVLFYYKTFSSETYKIVKITPSASNLARFEWSIPYSEFDKLGVEYFFEFIKNDVVQARSAVGTTTILYQNLEIPYTNFGKNTENYEMISIPLNLKDNKVVDVFKDELGEANVRNWRVFRYANGSTAAFEGAEVKAGEGFWQNFRTLCYSHEYGRGKSRGRLLAHRQRQSQQTYYDRRRHYHTYQHRHWHYALRSCPQRLESDRQSVPFCT